MAGRGEPSQVPEALNIGPRGSERYCRQPVSLDIRPGVADVQGDLRALPFREQSFSFVECHHVLEHLERDEAPLALRELWRVLRPGGTLDISVPDMERCARTLLAGNLEVLKNIYSPDPDLAMHHRWGYTPASLKAALRAAGFRDVRLADHYDMHGLRMVAIK